MSAHPIAPPAWRPRAQFWGMMFTLLLIGGLAALALTLFATDWLKSNPRLSVSLHSPMQADYSADPRGMLVPAVNISLVGEIIRQDPAAGDPVNPLATVVVVLQTPVPTVTPQFAPTNGPTQPPLPTATLGVGETPLPTVTITATIAVSWTPSATPPQASTATWGPTATQRPPTSTPQPPTATSSPPTAVPPTAVPPTAVPPTAVPPTAVPPTAVPTPDCGGGYPAPPGCPTVEPYPYP